MSSKRKKRVLLACVVVIPLAVLLVMRLRYDPAQKQLAAIRAAGLPLGATESDAWYLPVPVRDNRALAILEAARAHVQPAAGADPNSPKLGSLNAGCELSPKMLEAAEVYLAANRETIERLHEGARLKESRYPIDLSRGFATLVPHLAQIKSLVLLLRIEAVQCSRMGKVEEAVRALETALAVADSLRDEPILISALVRSQCTAIAVNGLERVLNEHRLSNEQLRRLGGKIGEAEKTIGQSYYRAMIGERAIALEAFEMSFREIERLSAGAASDAPESLGPFGFQLYRASGARKRDHSLYLGLMDRLIDAAQRDFPEALRKSEAVDKDLMAIYSKPAGRFMALTRQLAVPLTGSAWKRANISARLRCAQAALAIEQFRQEHKDALPRNLQELAPKYLGEIPTDPFDGGPLAYDRLAPKGFRVASPFESPSRKKVAKYSEDAPFEVLR